MKSLCQLFKLFIISFFILYNYTEIKAQDILWEKSYGGKHADYLMDAKPTPDYGFILAGSSLSKKTGTKTVDNNGDLDYWIWKMNEKGEGKLVGKNISAKWSGNNGTGSASGTVIVDISGKPTRIEWSNGVVFTRN